MRIFLRGCKSKVVGLRSPLRQLARIRISLPVARERIRPIVIGPSSPMPERDRAAVEGRAYDQGERPRGLDRSATSTAARCFGGVPRDVFKSVRDWKRWNERYRGKPIDETPGALRVALTDKRDGATRSGGTIPCDGSSGLSRTIPRRSSP
jgi:hypothetical protein